MNHRRLAFCFRPSIALALFAALLLLAGGIGVASGDDPVPRFGCAEPGFAEFDFWVGEWEVRSGDKLAGHNRIEKVQDGCALVEHWRGARGGTGTSLNIYDRKTGRWQQLWIDNRGERLELSGAREEDGSIWMQSTPDANGVVQSIRWSLQADGSVRQLWETVTAEGKRTPLFDGTYVKTVAD
jgi:hypothetical protein